MIILAVCDCLMQCDNLPSLVGVGLQVTSDPGDWIRCEALKACLPYLVPFEAVLVVFRARPFERTRLINIEVGQTPVALGHRCKQVNDHDGFVVGCLDRGRELEVFEQLQEFEGRRLGHKIVACEHDLYWKLRMFVQMHGVGQVDGDFVRHDRVKIGVGQSNVLREVQGEVL